METLEQVALCLAGTVHGKNPGVIEVVVDDVADGVGMGAEVGVGGEEGVERDAEVVPAVAHGALEGLTEDRVVVGMVLQPAAHVGKLLGGDHQERMGGDLDEQRQVHGAAFRFPAPFLGGSA